MTVYIEYVIIDNMVINFLILLLTCKFLKIESRTSKLLLIALLGTCVAVVSPFIIGLWQIVVKLLLGTVMPLLLLKKARPSFCIKAVLTFLFCTMLIGGACLMFCSLFNIPYVVENGGIAIYNFPVGLAVLLAIIIYYTVRNLIAEFYRQRQFSRFVYNVEFLSKNNSYKCRAFLDSGNCLVDEKSNQPIVIINIEVFSKLFPNIKIEDLLLKKLENLPLENLHQQVITSLNDSHKILVFKISQLKIFSENEMNIHNVMLGLSLKNFKKTLNTDCILPPALFED